MDVRTEIVTIFEDMFNGVDPHGIYPTSTAYLRLESLVQRARMEAVGYAYATCCVVLDDGRDPRTEEVPVMFERALVDLNGGPGDVS